MSRSSRSLPAVFAKPAVIAVATLAGLAAGLLGDGVYDGLAWLGLLVPVIVIVLALARRRPLATRRRK